MKKYLTFTLMVVLFSLMAAGAYAQTQSEPVKEQAKDQTRTFNDEGPQGDGTMESTRDRSAYETQQEAAGDATGRVDKALTADKAGDQEDCERTRERTDTGPQGDGTMTTERTRNSFETQQEAAGDATGRQDVTLDGDKAADQTQYFGDGIGNNHELGDNKRHGEDVETGEGGPIGPLDGTDKAGDQTQHFGDGIGNNYELGESHRRGELVEAGEPGPHGPYGLDVDDGLKIFGDDGDGLLDGDRHIWSPAELGGGAFGPNSAVSGFGEAAPAADDNGTAALDARGARAGRK